MNCTLEVNSITPASGVFSNSASVSMRTGQNREHAMTNASDRHAQAYVFLDVTLAARFAGLLPHDAALEQVRWKVERGQVKVWTVISARNEQLQQAIYDAELALLDSLPGLPIDLAVIYRSGRPIDQLVPADTHILRR